jgi:hypothetical protein
MTRGPDYQRERGERQEKRMLELLKEQPRTAHALAAAMHTGRSNVEIYIRRLRAKLQIFKSDHEPRVTGRPAPVWAVGAGQDVEYVPKRISTPIPSTEDRVAQARKFLCSAHTSADLAAHLNLTRGRANRLIAILRTPDPKGKRVLFICGWRHPGHRGDLSPIYKVGSKPDVPKPKETRAQRYARDKADPEKYERILKQRRAGHRVTAAKSKPRGPWAALGL